MSSTISTFWKYIELAWNIFYWVFILSKKFNEKFNSREEKFFLRAQNNLAHQLFSFFQPSLFFFSLLLSFLLFSWLFFLLRMPKPFFRFYNIAPSFLFALPNPSLYVDHHQRHHFLLIHHQPSLLFFFFFSPCLPPFHCLHSGPFFTWPASLDHQRLSSFSSHSAAISSHYFLFFPELLQRVVSWNIIISPSASAYQLVALFIVISPFFPSFVLLFYRKLRTFFYVSNIWVGHNVGWLGKMDAFGS